MVSTGRTVFILNHTIVYEISRHQSSRMFSIVKSKHRSEQDNALLLALVLDGDRGGR